MSEGATFEILDLPNKTQAIINYSLVEVMQELREQFVEWLDDHDFPYIPLAQVGTECHEIGRDDTGKLRVRIHVRVLAFIPKEVYLPGEFSVDTVLGDIIVLSNRTPMVLDVIKLPEYLH